MVGVPPGFSKVTSSLLLTLLSLECRCLGVHADASQLSGCRCKNACEEQTLTTLLLFVTSAYSIRETKIAGMCSFQLRVGTACCNSGVIKYYAVRVSCWDNLVY